MKKLSCPYCQNDDDDMIDAIRPGFYYCVVCARTFEVNKEGNYEHPSGDVGSIDEGQKS